MNVIKIKTLVSAALLLSGLSVFLWIEFAVSATAPIRIGVLHSLSGTMASSERPVVDATLLAVKQLNAAGGLLGRRVEAVVVDGKSDGPSFAAAAEKLISEERVSVVFGCWTSVCRKSVRPVFEAHNHLLFYPLQSEGLETSPNIVYTGASPNQQIIPAVSWAIKNLGKRFFLIGSDYIFPHVASEIVKDYVYALNAEIVGERYVKLDGTEFNEIIQAIKMARPDVVLNMINGDSNIAFFNQLHGAGISAQEIPVMSLSMTENELEMVGVEKLSGHYASWNYFQDIDNEANRLLLQQFRQEYGENRVFTDPMEAAFTGVKLWAQAVIDAASDDVNEVIKNIGEQSYQAPQGLVYVDDQNFHLWKTPRVARVSTGGHYEIVWQAERALQPVPYPGTRSEFDWNSLVSRLYLGWGQQWENAGS